MKAPAKLQPELSQQSRPRWWLVGILLVVGIALWLSVGRAIVDWPNQVPALMTGGAVVLLLLVPSVRRICLEALRAAEIRLKDHPALTAFIIAILSAAYFLFTAI